MCLVPLTLGLSHRVPLGLATIDDCGECLEPTDPFNESCKDCAGVPNGIAVLDDCGDCMNPSDPNFNKSCTDCAGNPNGSYVLDDCGLCQDPSDPTFIEDCEQYQRIYVPNVLHLSDSQNSQLKIYPAQYGAIRSIENYSIYDRWGGLLYKDIIPNVKEYNDWWPSGSSQLDSGCYMYKVEVLFNNGARTTLVGPVTLLN